MIELHLSGTSADESPGPGASNPLPAPNANNPVHEPWPQTAGSGGITWYDSAQRTAYLEEIHTASREAVAEIGAARTAGDLERAERAARVASAFRNTARAETQELLSPGGRVMSQALEQERSWTSMFSKYGGTSTFETYEAIALASGRSSRWASGLAGVGKYLGPLGVVVGLGVAGYEVSHAPPGQGLQTAVREGGGMVGGAVGATGGAALGAGAAVGVAAFLGLSGPPGWLVLGLGVVGGFAGGYLLSGRGRADAGALYDAAELKATEVRYGIESIYNLYGVPGF